MLSQPNNRVQAIKSKFENLNTDCGFKNTFQLNKQSVYNEQSRELNKENTINYEIHKDKDSDSDTSTEWSPELNRSHLYNKSDVKRSLSEAKKSLIRQISDPGKKLHRSHAFRCDRNKIMSPKRHGSCNGRAETIDFALKGEKKLSKDRLKRLSNLLEDQMKKERFVVPNESIVGKIIEVEEMPLPLNSIPDSEVPPHILEQYAKVVKPKRNDTDKQDGMTDSGVSSETENLEEEKTGRIKKILSQFEKPDFVEANSIGPSNDLCASSETIKLKIKNPHLTLTDTLKKALKAPLPPGPPPKKPPRVFVNTPIQESPEKEKKDTKKMLQKLEQVLQKREEQNTLKGSNVTDKNVSLRRPKEIHYLCTEILDITNKTLLPNSTNCFKSLNCSAISNNSTLSLPYTRLNAGSKRESLKSHSCSCDNLENDPNLTTFLSHKCTKCLINEQKHDQFKCHLNCECKTESSQFFVDNEHIYDEPFNDCGSEQINGNRRSQYGTLNLSKSMEDLHGNRKIDNQKIYDIPCELSRPATPEETLLKSIMKASDNSILNSKSISDLASICVSDTTSKSTNDRISKSIGDTTSKSIGDRTSKSLGDRTSKTDFARLRQSFEIGFKNDESNNPRSSVRNSVKFDFGDKRSSSNNDKLSSTSDITSAIEEVTIKFLNSDKPPTRPKPIFVKNKASKSTENLLEEKNCEKKFSTEGRKSMSDGRKLRRARDANSGRFSLQKKDSTQLDVDRENLNRLMNEIYETVTACNMADKPSSFPTENSDGSTSEDSVKLSRSLTEKRKNYVRRVSSRVAYLDPKNIKNTRFRHQTSVCSYKSEIIDNPYNTFRSWKSFRTSQNNLNSKMDRDSIDSKCNLTDSKGNLLSMKNSFDSSDTIDNESIDEKTGCVDIELPFEPRDRGLFNVCLLVGLNYLTGQAYVKSIFPDQVQVPPHIENLIFPETLSAASKGEWTADAKGAQCYSLVLTDERGERSYGYCRRVLPEGATTCLPLCYCLIGKYRAPGFYYKVLQEIESHHGSSEIEIKSILQQLFETDFPNPGEEITITYTKTEDLHRNSVNPSDNKCKTMPDMRRSGQSEYSDKENEFSDSADSEVRKSESVKLPDFYDLENNNSLKKIFLSFEGPRTKSIKMGLEPRCDEHNLSVLLDCLGTGLTIKVFGSLLLERKVLIMGDQLSQVSSCMEALQSALYPFVWQQPLISTIPAEIQREVLEAPLPLLAGALLTTGGVDTTGVLFDEGMLIDLTHPSKVLFYQGDESTILPTACYKTLKTALQMESKKDKGEDATRNVMISEAFLRFFVDILGDFWKYFSVGELKEGGLGMGDIVFDKEAFVKNSPSKQNQYFLEWFTETAMFNHFIQNMAIYNRETSYSRQSSNTSLPSTSESFTSQTLVDTPLPDFYELFNERVRSRNKTNEQKFDKSNYKNAMNKKMKLLKTKLRELVT